MERALKQAIVLTVVVKFRNWTSTELGIETSTLETVEARAPKWLLKLYFRIDRISSFGDEYKV